MIINPVKTQIIPDNSLSNQSFTINRDATIKDTLAELIKGGAIRDNNLFHSFEQFNVSDGSKVYLASPNKIANILTRVIEHNISKIFGTLGIL